jgi:myo-inositol-1(or 4)-monophosphatase
MDITEFNINLDLAKEAAKESGKLLLENKKDLNKSLKSNNKDTKLIADLKAENLIKEIIVKKSKYPILAEESGKSVKDLGDTFWVIDPLDGTANYSRGLPMCCVSIGLVKNMKPLLGVIYDFNNKDVYVGNSNTKIATLNNEKIIVSDYKKKSDGVLVTGLPVNSDYSNTSLEKIIYDMQSWKKIRMIGSAAMASCYIASGKAEMYKEKGVYLWDILAGAAIVESAGGIADISNIRENFQVDVVFSNSYIKD